MKAALLHRSFWMLAFAAGALGWAATGQAAASLEYQVKAAYLAKFAPFVEWPAAALSTAGPLNICAVGDDLLGPALSALGRQNVGERRVSPRRLSRAEDGGDCHILYVRRSASQSVGEALSAVRGSPVLTITDAADGDGPKGVLHFVVVNNRVRFEVDAEAAARNRLALSSKLQSLALSARGG